MTPLLYFNQSVGNLLETLKAEVYTFLPEYIPMIS